MLGGIEMEKGNRYKARIELIKSLKKAIKHADLLNKMIDDQHAMLVARSTKKAA